VAGRGGGKERGTGAIEEEKGKPTSCVRYFSSSASSRPRRGERKRTDASVLAEKKEKGGGFVTQVYNFLLQPRGGEKEGLEEKGGEEKKKSPPRPTHQKGRRGEEVEDFEEGGREFGVRRP